MDLTLLLLMSATLVLVAALWIRVVRTPQGSGAEAEARIGARIDALADRFHTSLTSSQADTREAVARVREESSAALEKRLGEFGDRLNLRMDEQKGALQQSLAANREESRAVLEAVRGAVDARLNQSTAALEGRLGALQEANEKKLDQIRENIHQRLGENLAQNFESLKGVIERLGDLKQTTDRVIEISSDIQRLNNILSGTKARGNFGEFQLKTLLAESLPENTFTLQYRLSGGAVDAVIHMPDGGKLPIDSKFPLEAFERSWAEGISDETRRAELATGLNAAAACVKDIAKKYIHPPETTDMAFMFVPSESIYMEIVRDGTLTELARKHRVFPAGPTTLMALMHSLAVGFRGMHIQEAAQRLSADLAALQRDFQRFSKEYGVLGSHLENTAKAYTRTLTQVQKFDQRLDRMALPGATVEENGPRALPDPAEEEPA